MALFPWSKNKTPALPGPSAELPWTLTVGVDPGTCSDPTWQQVEEGLYGLNQEQDSFLILEQQDPQNPNAYWFIQCAVARMGPDQGRYSVEVGFPGARGGDGGELACYGTLPALGPVVGSAHFLGWFGSSWDENRESIEMLLMDGLDGEYDFFRRILLLG